MRFGLFFIFSFFLAQFSQAATVCKIVQNQKDGTVYDKEIYSVSMEPSDNPDDTQFAYIFPDGSVKRLTWKEVQNKKSFADVNHTYFYTFRVSKYQSNPNSFEVGFGDVDVKRKNVRRLIALTDAEERVALWGVDRFLATCLPPE
jgi:hypothetical protein